MPTQAADGSSLRDALAAGALSDEAFDALLEGPAQARSQQFWSPLSVARSAALMFRRHGVRRVLDVGSGAGKFCLAAAACQPSIEFLGVERRAHLVEVANQLVERLGLSNVRFVAGDALEHSWDGFDGFYFFNPFSENMAPAQEKLDQSVELSAERFFLDLRRSHSALRGVRKGAVVITYHGIGTPIPSSYQLAEAQLAGTDRLRAWVRKHEVEADWCHVETVDSEIRQSTLDLQNTAERWRKRFEG